LSQKLLQKLFCFVKKRSLFLTDHLAAKWDRKTAGPQPIAMTGFRSVRPRIRARRDPEARGGVGTIYIGKLFDLLRDRQQVFAREDGKHARASRPSHQTGLLFRCFFSFSFSFSFRGNYFFAVPRVVAHGPASFVGRGEALHFSAATYSSDFLRQIAVICIHIKTHNFTQRIRILSAQYRICR